jgi:hypothetical protein
MVELLQRLLEHHPDILALAVCRKDRNSQKISILEQ